MLSMALWVLKTHSKIALVVRREEDGISRYVHLGTGNYNDSDRKAYTQTVGSSHLHQKQSGRMRRRCLICFQDIPSRLSWNQLSRCTNLAS